ncbi:TonB-dependent receptor [Alteromonas aestuariivivens]|uniref:TonB-dependent receptor n=1 Tax=Alteromonas aestuariivivens TaxID=1938339 RepID=A0A3D8MCQ8_9ALTE|nr:TonB-dependent receptor [Alteromonas aestuariivivens]RDV28009.1 TonB-dependent receptor [Alteromonas aestuariivivens]
MKNLSRISSSVLLAFSPLSFAATITGTVTDIQGAPIAGAEVKLEGSRRVETTDEAGRYELRDIAVKDVHIHVFSDKFIHGDRDLGVVEQDQVVDFVLAPTSMDNIVVTATALQTSVLESVTPVSVIGAEQLRKIQAPTLGETLKATPGVHSTYFGPVSSSPVIRGNDGPRVKIVQNGLDVSDVSRVGPDHNVAANTSSATQVEVLRGPATLQYGSGAIGGVINVVDKRIPKQVPYALEGEAELRYSGADKGQFAKVDVTAGKGNLAYHFDGFIRETEDVRIPGYASLNPDEDEPKGVLENSAMDSSSYTAGFSYVQDEGYLGFAVEQLDNLYGVPGHEHHHEDEHEEQTEPEADTGTQIDVDMTRYQLAGEWNDLNDTFTNIRFAASYTDYQHAELEGQEIGTVFSNKGSDLRLTANHGGTGAWHGVIGVQYHNADYEALGEEAFTPATDTASYALFMVEQKKVGDFTVELGARFERTEYQAGDTEWELHTEHLETDHDEEHADEAHVFTFDEYRFTSASFSAGVNWEYQQGHGLAVTLSRNERAPSQQELFAGGQHLATQTFEVGLVYDLDDTGEVSESLLGAEEEVSTNIDITLRRFIGEWGYTVSLFYNSAGDYIYQAQTGLFTEAGHEEEAGAEEHGDEEGLPVFYFQQADATIYGAEAELYVDLTPNWRLEAFGDLIRAEIDSQDLPRTPPMRLGASLHYDNEVLSAEFGAVWNDSQKNVAPFESVTSGYTLLNANLQYSVFTDSVEWVMFARADNLTDEDARVHTSFLKEQAPLPGRNFSFGVRAVF